MTDNNIHSVFPYLRIRDANAAIDFYKKVFDAEEMFRLHEPGGRIGHAQLKFGSAVVMLSDEYPEYGIQSPSAFGGTGSSVHLHVDDVDAMTERAKQAGAEVLMEPTDQFYGERSGTVRDPAGHEWNIGHSIEDVSTGEMQRRYTDMLSG